MTITPAMVGCWIDGHRGWILVRIAQDYGFELTDEDETYVAGYETGDSDSGAVFEISDEAEDYLNTIAPEGHTFGWHDGEFFLMPHNWWAQDA